MQTANSEQRRVLMLSVVMLIVLAASVAVAWSLVVSRGVPSEWGAEIMDLLHRDGLAVHWRQPQIPQWYVITQKGKPVGWRLALRQSTPDGGGFEGLNVRFHGSVAWARWRLNSHATEGEYRSQTVVAASKGRGLLLRTKISLGNGRVVVNDSIHGQSQADVRTNYIPEGTLGLACFLTAQEGKPARFDMVFDSEPPSSTGRVQFGGAMVDQIAKTDTGWRANITRTSAAGTSEETLFFNSQGQVVRAQHGDVTESASSQQDVLAAFPGAKIILRQILSDSGFSLPATVSKPADETTDIERPN